ncbi:MAG: copper amine oxidase N-terminal domain-containing protein [Defluviitaleaceae bacterium]|nr:copper amine oxidase N-terminal domain-containing protein [Defluviitaleaceae bacterium]
MKKIFVIVVIALGVLFLMPSENLYAQTPRLRINGEFWQGYPQPVMYYDTVLVPFRAVAETLGFTVRWLPRGQIATLVSPTHNASVQIGNRRIMVNDEMPQWGFSTVRLVDGFTMVCLYAINNATGMYIQWDWIGYIADIFPNEASRPALTPRPVSPQIQTSISGVDAGLTPQQLVQSLNYLGIELIRPCPDCLPSPFEMYFEDAQDGRWISEAGCLSFSFRTEKLTIHYTFDERMFISVLCEDVKTSQGVGIGSSRSQVIEAHGTSYLSPEFFSGIIEYFDGVNYLYFVFSDDVVWSWGIGRMSIFEFNANHHGVPHGWAF